jgi:4-hydroxyphenylacetate 3-monooxygenase
MPARKGADFLKHLRENPPEIYHRGERIQDFTTHPEFRGHAASLAALYDLQWQHPDVMLVKDESGDTIARSYSIPKTEEDIRLMSKCLLKNAEFTCGMMGRSPDYLNRAMASYAGGWKFLAEQDPRFGENAKTLHKRLSKNDLCMTHTLINPQANRAVSVAAQKDPYLGARVKEERADGLVIRGARMLATAPVSDEIMVFPSTLLTSNPEDAPYAFGFCIPSATKGLKFLCRETVSYNPNGYDHPLGARFEEQDAVVIFDDVFVPWENVLLYRNVDVCNKAYAASGAVVHMSHQVVCKNIAKSEFLLGLASLMVDSIGIEQFQHVHEKLAELWVAHETQKAFLRAAEADCHLDEYGVMRPAWDPLDAARNLFPKTYPRLVQIIQQLGASGLVAMPTHEDLKGPLSEEIKKYYQSARMEAHDRIPLFRLAWDAAVSAFGTRQALYEYFFFGDPVRMAGALVKSHPPKAAMDKVRHFLEKMRDEVDDKA